MKNNILRLSFLSLFVVGFISSCRQDVASPIRNVRFDPQLINRLQTAENNSCTNYAYLQGKESKALGIVSTEEITVAFEGNVTFEDQKNLINSYGFFKGLGQPKSANGLVSYALHVADGLNCKQVELLVTELNKERGVLFAAPSFLTGDEGKAKIRSLTNEVLVTLDKGASLAELQQTAVAANAVVLKKAAADTYILRVGKNSEQNALELANALQHVSGIASAEPVML